MVNYKIDKSCANLFNKKYPQYHFSCFTQENGEEKIYILYGENKFAQFYIEVEFLSSKFANVYSGVVKALSIPEKEELEEAFIEYVCDLKPHRLLVVTGGIKIRKK